MKKFFKVLVWLVAVGLVVHIIASITGYTYLYKGLVNTYLVGRKGPNIDEYKIFHNREVATGTYQPWEVSPHINQVEMPDYLLQECDSYQTAAYLVIKDKKIIYERYWDGYSVDGYTNSFSMAKTIVSILTGIALEEGKIQSLDDPIGQYLPDYTGEGWDKITIRHLLTMSSGIGFDESYSGPFNFTAKAYYGNDLRKAVNQYVPVTDPGINYDYQSGNTQILGFLLEEATGTSLSEYASKHIWKHIGAKHPAWWSLEDKGGSEKAFCCFNSNARDFARIGQLFLDSGRWNGEQIVSEDYVLASVQPAPLHDIKLDEQNIRYGHAWWLLDHEGKEFFYARGMLGQYVFVLPSENLIIVRLGNGRASNQADNPPDDVYTWLNAAYHIAGLE